MSEKWVPVVLALIGLLGGGGVVYERSGFNAEVERLRATLAVRVATLPDQILKAYERGLEKGQDCSMEE